MEVNNQMGEAQRPISFDLTTPRLESESLSEGKMAVIKWLGRCPRYPNRKHPTQYGISLGR